MVRPIVTDPIFTDLISTDLHFTDARRRPDLPSSHRRDAPGTAAGCTGPDTRGETLRPR